MSLKDPYGDKYKSLLFDRFLTNPLCQSCSTKLAPGARFCHMCAEKVVREATPRIETRIRIEHVKVCPVCKHENSLRANNCDDCNVRFTDSLYDLLNPKLYSSSGARPSGYIINKF